MISLLEKGGEKTGREITVVAKALRERKNWWEKIWRKKYSAGKSVGEKTWGEKAGGEKTGYRQMACKQT